MSGWGATERSGEPISAWEYRELYLEYGERYSEFFCPFCDIPLVAMLIYTDEELSRSPHFSARDGKHLFDCEGEPLELDQPDRKPPRAHYKPRRMGIPEALSDRPPQREYRPNSNPRKNVVPPSSIEVSVRRRNTSSLGKPIPKTYLLRSIVEAHDIEVKEIYKRANQENWSKEVVRAELKKVLSSMPLRLEDHTNYDDGFRGPTFVHWKFKRIYNGKGIVVHSADGLVIKSMADGKLKGETMPFRVLIDHAAIDPNSPKSHLALLDKLETFEAAGTEIRWYAYGLASAQSGNIVVPIRNLDHLYIKKAYKEKRP